MNAAAYHNPCQVCRVRPWMWATLFTILGYIAAHGATILFADHEKTIEIPALTARMNKQTERLNEVEKNVAVLPMMQQSLERIESKLDKQQK